MGLENLVLWTRSKLSRYTGGDVPVTSASSFEPLTSGRFALPSLDLFENESEFRVVVDVPGATTGNTHVTWNEVDTLAVRVQRAGGVPGIPWLTEYEESDWWREIALSPDVDGTKATSTVRDGVMTIRLPKRRTTSSKLLPVYAG